MSNNYTPVYVLTRTSHRPGYFSVMRKSVLEQDYPNIIHIVHSDDPRDDYVEGDIIIRGPCYGPEFGNAPYNLYCNRLLDAIPKEPGWIHFIDDDDFYMAPDVISKLVSLAEHDKMIVGRVVRKRKDLDTQNADNVTVVALRRKTFQTERFMFHTDYKQRARWWAHTSGDHNFCAQLNQILDISFYPDLWIAEAITGKNRGRLIDESGYVDYSGKYPSEKLVTVRAMKTLPGRRMHQGRMYRMPYGDAYKLEQKKYVRVTYPELIIEGGEQYMAKNEEKKEVMVKLQALVTMSEPDVRAGKMFVVPESEAGYLINKKFAKRVMDTKMVAPEKKEEQGPRRGRPPASQKKTKATALMTIVPLGAVGAEVGVFKGKTASALLAGGHLKHLHMIDPWEPYEPVDEPKAMESHRQMFEGGEDNYETALKAVRRYQGSYTIHRKPSIEAAADFEDGSLDFVFLDGNHDYDYVKNELAAWYPKVRPGGIFCGHDYGKRIWPGVKKAVDEYFSQAEKQIQKIDPYVWWVIV